MLVGMVVILPRLDIRANSSFTITHTTQEDFAGGSVSETLDIDVSPGEVRLKQDTNTLESELDEGYSPMNNTVVSEEQIMLNQGFTYNFSFSHLLGAGVTLSFRDLDTGYLYVGTWNDGLVVIDTNTNSVVTRYDTASTPALTDNSIDQASINDGLLYISTYNNGLHVIDTKQTVDPSDDILVVRYSTSSSPTLPTGPGTPNWVRHAFLDNQNNLLYISTHSYGAGVAVIDTNGTVTAADDVLVKTYNQTTIPGSFIWYSEHTFLDSETGYLYVSSDGVSVIDTNTDTLVTRYAVGHTSHSFLDSDTGYLYMSTNEGLIVIDVNSSAEIINYYYTGSDPALRSDLVKQSFVDPNTGYLYIATTKGLSVIDTGTNTLVTHYNKDSLPALTNTGISHIFYDTVTNHMYLSGEEGLDVIDITGNYSAVGSYYSSPYRISEIPSDTLKWAPLDGNISLQYRVGEQNTVWMEDFDGGIGSYIGDSYDWGGSFQNVSVQDGILTLSEPSDWGLGYSWFDTGLPVEYFPIGSRVKAKVRVNSSREEIGFRYEMFTDEYDMSSDNSETINEWVYLDFTEFDPFSTIGIKIESGDEEDWAVEDSFQIDWISVIQPDDQWSDWSEPCSTSTGCTIDPADLEGKEWIQYRFNLSTDDPTQTPIVNSVTFASGYQDSGEFVSSVVDAGQIVDWDTLTAEATTPTGTSIAFFTRTGNTPTPDGSWSDWSVVNSPITSPNGQYLQYKTVLTTTDENVTPVLNSVTLGYATLETTLTPTPTPIPGTVPPPTFITLGKIGGQPVTDGVYTYYFDNGKNLTFSGTTSPNAYVLLTIESDPVTCETQADDEGEWSCTFSEEIPDGYHTLTVSAYYEGSAVLSSEKYTLGIGVGLAETGVPAMVSLLTGGVLLIGGAVVWYRRKEH